MIVRGGIPDEVLALDLERDAELLDVELKRSQGR